MKLATFAPWALLAIAVAYPLFGQGTVTFERLVCLTPEQEEILSHMSIVFLDDGQGGLAKTIEVQGVNLRIVNGMGTTETVNGVGNLIVGYNGAGSSGSHNIAGGRDPIYTSYGGLVVGADNDILAAWASVTGGWSNIASGEASSVSGGGQNHASFHQSSVSGGAVNNASGQQSWIGGGNANTAPGIRSSVSGGSNNSAVGETSSVSGGFLNFADAIWSSVSGGRSRNAPNQSDWVAGSLFEDN